MSTKFENIFETSKLRTRGQYLDSVSYVLFHFLTLRLFENLAPGRDIPRCQDFVPGGNMPGGPDAALKSPSHRNFIVSQRCKFLLVLAFSYH